jgi:hypothetical protein
MSQISKEAVAGVWPVDYGEAHIATAWPSISATGLGRFLGGLYSLPLPLGLLLHLATLPLPIICAAAMYVMSGFRRYTLSTTRIRVNRGIRGASRAEVGLANLDEVRLVQRAGQPYYLAADLELVSGGQTVLTLAGVRHADAFHRNILRARDALVLVKQCREAEAAAAAG